jgi:DNA replicative helicase MCM subunit Mcm2 (Cdc46/Mcm family)
LATAHAKIRLSKIINKKDCEVALQMLTISLFNETGKEEDDDINEKFADFDSEMPSKESEKLISNSKRKRNSNNNIKVIS